MTKARSYSREKEFTFEVIAHYPLPEKKKQGTFHVYWEEMDLDLRGIYYNIKRGKDPWIRLPSQRGMLNGEPCSFPLYSFGNVLKWGRFIMTLREAFKKYAETEKIY